MSAERLHHGDGGGGLWKEEPVLAHPRCCQVSRGITAAELGCVPRENHS